MSHSEILETIESIQNMLVDRATGGFPNENDYSELRQILIEDPFVCDDLPRFLRTCRSLSQFWAYISKVSSTYAGRRSHIWDNFSPLLDKLENRNSSPVDKEASETLEKFDSENVHRLWLSTLERRKTDPEGAITLSRTLLESVCKSILEEYEGEIEGNPDLPKLYSKVSTYLNIAPNQHSEKLFKRILGGCSSVVEGLGALRNELSDAHGKGKRHVKPAPRHAELAVNLSGAMATFIVATYEEKNKT